MTLRHGPVNGPMKHAPMDTTETLMAYARWRLDCMKVAVVWELLPSIEQAADALRTVLMLPADTASE